MSKSVLRGTLYDRHGQVLSDPRRIALETLFGMYPGGVYTGARSDRRATKDWNTWPQGADADSIGDLETLRSRTRDLVRNAPIAAGAISTVVTKIVGAGLAPSPRIDRDILRLTEEQADEWERTARRFFRFHAEGKYLDASRQMRFAEMQRVVCRAKFESGDVFVLRRSKPWPGALVRHCLQIIEADRVCNPLTTPDRPGFAAGVETDDDGVRVRCHVASRHPRDLVSATPVTWKTIPWYAPSGREQILHQAWRKRPEQTRGVPYLATVIEPLKQLDRYGEAELMAAVVGALFTVFVKTETGADIFQGASPGVDPATNKPFPPNYRLGTGGVVTLLPGEDVQIANPGRPNATFDPFVQSIIAQIGIGVELPYEILTKRFQASYSAARGSQLEAWHFFMPERALLAAEFCQPTYEAVIEEGIAAGHIEAPGFFDDPMVRQAWLGCEWTGSAPGHIDERVGVEAAQMRITAGLSTLERETAAISGDWEDNHRQQVKERRMRERDGLDKESVAERIRTEPQQLVGDTDEQDERDARERRHAA